MDAIKWIKLTTNMFDNNKIKYIRTLPDGNNIVLFWVMLLTKAGQCNCNGYIFITENIPYTEDLLAEEFKFSITMVKAALRLFEKLNMITFYNSVICIENWEKHQNIEGLEKIKEQNKLRQQKYRERKKLALENNVNRNVTHNGEVTPCNALERDIDKDIDKDINTKVFIEKWNALGLNKIINIKNKRLQSLKARVEEYGADKVLEAIENINKSDFLKGINDRGWRADFDWLLKPNNFIKVLEGRYENTKPVKQENKDKFKFNNFEPRSYDYDSLEKKLLGWEGQ